MGSIYALTFFTEIALAKLLIQMLTYVDPQGSNNLLKAAAPPVIDVVE